MKVDEGTARLWHRGDWKNASLRRQGGGTWKHRQYRRRALIDLHRVFFRRTVITTCAQTRRVDHPAIDFAIDTFLVDGPVEALRKLQRLYFLEAADVIDNRFPALI